MDDLFKAERAVLDQCTTIAHMRDEGARRVAAFKERKRQRVIDDVIALDADVITWLRDGTRKWAQACNVRDAAVPSEDPRGHWWGKLFIGSPE